MAAVVFLAPTSAGAWSWAGAWLGAAAGWVKALTMVFSTLAGWAIYLAATLIGMTATSPEAMLAARFLQGFGAGVGFTLAMVLMSSIRERLELADVPGTQAPALPTGKD